MDDAEIGKNSYVAAQAFVPAGMNVPEGHLVAGIPAKVRREVTEEEIAWKKMGTEEYQRLARRCLQSMQEVDALSEIEADRPKLDMEDLPSLHVLKGR